MKFHLSNIEGINTFSGYGVGYVMINQVRYDRNLVVFPDRIIENWCIRNSGRFAIDDFDEILTYQPEIILLGTGEAQRFPSPQLIKAMLNARIGLEVMDTFSACRTYNILSTEGRRVAAALLV